MSVAACGDLLAIADAGNHRVCIFTLRGTFLRAIGGKPSKFSKAQTPGQFVKPPGHVALAEGHLFVLEDGGATRVHVLCPDTGEPIGMIHPPYNLKRTGDGTEGALTGLCIDSRGLYVSSVAGPARILQLPKK